MNSDSTGIRASQSECVSHVWPVDFEILPGERSSRLSTIFIFTYRKKKSSHRSKTSSPRLAL